MKKILLSATAILAALSVNAQQNLGFETWASGSPSNWTYFLTGLPVNTVTNPALGGTITANGVAAAPAKQMTTGAVEGTSYVKLTTVTRAGSTNPNLDGVFGGTAFQQFASTVQYTDMSFSYKYTRAGMDSAMVYIEGTKWNTATNEPDLVGQGFKVISANQSAWTSANVDITWASAPDSITIIVTSSKGDVFGSSTPAVDNSQLDMDKIMLIGGPVGLEEVDMIGANVYPNPTADVLNFKVNGTEATAINIYSLDGKLLISKDVNGAMGNINVSELNTGMYIYQIATTSGETVKSSFVKK